MFILIILVLNLILVFLPFASIANALETNINDLLIPEITSMSEGIENKGQLDQSNTERETIDDFLGPKDIFPFLPDNHRDSGTGKFNSF